MTTALLIPVQRLPHSQDLELPIQATSASSGVDLAAAIDNPVSLVPGGMP